MPAKNWWINNNGICTLKGDPQYIHEDGTHLRNSIDADTYVNVYGGEVTAWVDDLGTAPDIRNQMILDDVFILKCIHTVRRARSDFLLVVPTLTHKEQYRFQVMAARNPAFNIMIVPEEVKVDRMVKISAGGPIRTTGRFGGTRIG